MYLEHFGLSEAPFNITPDPRFFYPSVTCKDAFRGISKGITEGQGLIVLTGESGTGKTSVLRKVQEQCEPNIRTLMISNSRQNFSGLLRLLLARFGLSQSPPEVGAMRQELTSRFVQQLESDQITVLLIDEAQDLDLTTLVEIKSLAELKSATKSSLQIVLAGRPELISKLETPELQSMKERVNLWYRLEPLTKAEVGPYINHRLARAGYQGNGLFLPEAIERIALCSGGIPISINIMCDNALLAAYTATKQVSAATVDQVSRELQLAEDTEPREIHGNFSRSPVVAALILLFMATTGVVFYSTRSEGERRNLSTLATASQQAYDRTNAGIPQWIPEQAGKTPETPVPSRIDNWSEPQTNHAGNALVFVHSSQTRDRAILKGIGDALRADGYKVPEARFVRVRTQGDVRFFFMRDRRDAERVKSLVESELGRRGYPISLKLLERDGRKFEFAAPGNIEVWLPPLGSSSAKSSRSYVRTYTPANRDLEKFGTD